MSGRELLLLLGFFIDRIREKIETACCRTIMMNLVNIMIQRVIINASAG